MRLLRYAASLAGQNMQNRVVPSALTVVIVALAVALGVSVLVLTDGVQRGITQAADAFGVLVVGPKGSAQQLILSSVMLQGAPVGLFDTSALDPIRHDFPNVTVAPLAFADNLAGFSLIGTDTNFFQLRRTVGAPPAFAIANGRLFAAPFEAVLGAEAAAKLGLKIGDRFNSSHGVSGRSIEADIHTQEAYTVVGMLGASGSPYDRAIFTPVESIWDTHADIGLAGFRIDPADADEALIAGKLTAALIIPTQASYTDIYRIAQRINNTPVAQAAFPGQEIGGLFDLLAQGVAVLNAVRWLALIMAALTVLLSLYSTTIARLPAIAVMRSLGGGRGTIFAMIVIEAVALSVAGVVGGALIGHVLAAAIGSAITVQSAIPVLTRVVWDQEALLLIIPIVFGAVAGLIPAARTYRIDVVETLFANT